MEESFKSKVEELIKKAKEKGKLKTYAEFSETEDSGKYKLAEDEVQYYTSKNEKGE